jgi:RNA polymerase sigma-70 factor (ECF subfamily)
MSRVDASRLEAATPSPTPVAAVAPSLEALYRDYFQFVWRTARRLGVEAAQIDDVVQDVFVVVHRQLAHYEARTTPRAWLFSIARRVAADHRRARRRKGDLVPIHDQLAAADDGPLRAALNKEKSDVILEFLSTLDDDLRAAFILCELEQLTAPEIAQAVDASTSAVYSRIRTARLAFAAYVRDRHPELMGDSHG